MHLEERLFMTFALNLSIFVIINVTAVWPSGLRRGYQRMNDEVGWLEREKYLRMWTLEGIKCHFEFFFNIIMMLNMVFLLQEQ